MSRKVRIKKPDYVKSQFVLAIILALSLIILGAVLYFVVITKPKNLETNSTIGNVETNKIEDTEQKTDSVDNASSKELFDQIAIEKALNSWVSNSGGTAGVMIMTEDGEVLASNLKDRVFFAASIYKLYVAYAGYLQIDRGQADANEIYLNGKTRAECLDLMIRESDSPCAEKLWNELGKEELTNELKELGIENTSMTNISTTAEDAAKQLSLILTSSELSAISKAKLLKSMQDQIYRDTFNKGFSDNVTVRNKIGFRELVEYHDTAIIELEDGRKVIVSVLTENVGTKQIVELARILEPVL